MLFAITAKGLPVDIHAEGLAWGCEDLASAMTSALRKWTFVPARDSEGRAITVQVAMPVRVVRNAGAGQAIASVNLESPKLVRPLL